MVGAIRSRGLELSERMEGRFDWNAVGEFYSFLQDQNERGGFFSRGDADKILERHVYECLIFVDYVASASPVSRETTLCDAGTGPGLPGYLFACLHESPRLTLVDSSRRRLGLLEQYHAQTGRPSIDFGYVRLEELRATFDVITLRALIPFPQSLELVTSLQRVGGRVFLSLGRSPGPVPQELGYVSRETYTPPELSFLGARTFLHVEKIKKQNSLYPRPWKTIQQEIRSCRESTQ